ncbi:hypothetical protein FRB96_003918 [Tulasnella sp. 330]|nr:hypothetical protein FRB96_003918 [Tulasnella sp. 330]KAG8876769.1 hypothetical protein FRB98_007033 [Tulasnella sp. 332]
MEEGGAGYTTGRGPGQGPLEILSPQVSYIPSPNFDIEPPPKGIAMDPSDPSSFNLQHTKLANGRNYRYCDQTPTDHVHEKTPVLLLMHGFPESWYEWRYQIGPWVRRGWRIIAPDMLGYGGTDKPDDVSLYTPLSIAAEMAGLLDALDLQQPVVIVAHDWGAPAAWAFAIRYTERVRSLIAISVPYQPPLPMSLTVPQLVEVFGSDVLGYWLFFDSPEAPAIIDANISNMVDLFWRSHDTTSKPPLYPPGALQKYITGEWKIESPSTILSEKERQWYIDTLKAGGIEKPLNYYKSTPYRYGQEQELKLNPVIPSTIPILLIVPTGESITSAKAVERTRPFVPSMEVVHPVGAHFVMVESGAEVAKMIGEWLEEKLK